MVDYLKQLQEIIDDYVANMDGINEKRLAVAERDYQLAAKEVNCWNVLQQNLKIHRKKDYVLERSEDEPPPEAYVIP